MHMHMQTHSMASSLPLELQQHVFSYLEPRSFYAARNVCRWWRHASKDSVTLARQLSQLPIEPIASAKTMNAGRLQSLYDDAARVLMLGMSVDSNTGAGKSLSERVVEPKVTISGDGCRAATLDNRQITLYDLTTPDCKILSRRTLNDLRSAIGGGPWFKCAPSSVHELALSSRGNILAVAMDRTIQVYDLEAEEDSWPVSAYISSASGHYIAGLQFEHNDSILRVQLSNKGAIVYLGTPSNASADNLQHWQGKSGLRHTFLDSTVLSRNLRPLSETGISEALAGLQLLRSFEDGWLFAAQKRCTTSNSANYCLGFVAVSTLETTTTTSSSLTTTEKLAYVVAELPSSRNSTPLPEIIHGVWQDLPSAHVQHPHFSLSADDGLLAMSENVGVPSAPTQSGLFSRVFVYRLPSLRCMLSTLQRLRRAESCREKQQQQQQQEQEQERENCATDTHVEPHSIQRLPLSIGSVKGKVLDFAFDRVDGEGSRLLCQRQGRRRYQVSATTELGTKAWSLLDS